MTQKKVQINEGTIKKGNTSPPPAQSRPQAPQGQASGSSSPSSGGNTGSNQSST